MTDTTATKPATKRPRKMAREPKTDVTLDKSVPDATPAEGEPATANKAPTKSAQVQALLQRPEGASLDELVTATGWLPHTTRAALTGLKKKGHAIAKQKVDGVTRYTITPAALA